MIVTRAFRFVRDSLRKIIRVYNRLRLRNKNFTLIAKDCTGGLLLYELFQRFDTPTINAYFYAGDFVKFCRDMKFYVSQEVKECILPEKSCPVGTLGEADKKITIYFLHYDSFTHAKQKWEERCARIHWDNLYFIMTDGTGCDYEVAKEFDALPYEHKALLTYRDLPGIKSAVKLNITKLLAPHGIGAPDVFAFRSKLSMRRVINDWDYVAFLNS